MLKKRISPTLSNELLQSMRCHADPVADEVVDRIFSSENPSYLLKEISSVQFNDEVLSDRLPEFIKTYFFKTSVLPEWASNRNIQLSAAFFEHNGQQIMLSLMLLALPYCYAAGEDTEILLRSQRIQKDTRKRLAETGQFVYDVMHKNAFKPSGRGIRSIQKVRLMHAVIRYHIQKHNQWSGTGLPINQESMAGTNLSFSLIILRGLRKLHVSVSNEDQKAYLHTWNVIGYLLGIDNALLPESIHDVVLLEQLIRQRHFKKTASGQILTKALIDVAVDFFPKQKPEEFLYPMMNYLLGDEVANYISIPEGKSSTSIIELLKLKNTVEGIFHIQSGKVIIKMQYELMKETANKKTDFHSPLL